MEETLIIIMLKNKRTGFFEEELGAFDLLEYEKYLINIFGEKNNNKITITMTVTVDKEVEDWEYNAILDYYDEEKLLAIEEVIGVEEEKDCYTPNWIIKLEYIEDVDKMKKILIKILKEHTIEIKDVYREIKYKKEDYM